MAEFISVGKSIEQPSGMIRQIAVANGTKICLANVEGTFYAIGGQCTHMRGPLGNGKLEGTIVTCPWHGSRFDVTSGAVVGPPAMTAEPSYEVRVVGDDVQVVI